MLDESTTDYKNLTENNEKDVCSSTDVVHQFIHSSCVTAVGIIIVMSFLEGRQKAKERKGCCRRLCCGWALTVPINMLDDYNNRWSYACCFGSITNTLMILFIGPEYFNLDINVCYTALIGLASAVEVCIIFYPFFLCISSCYVKTGSLIGFLYASTWLSFTTTHVVQCQLKPFSYFPPNGLLIISIPSLICLVGVEIRFLHVFYIYCSSSCSSRKQKHLQSDLQIAHEWQINYAKRLVNAKQIVNTPLPDEPTKRSESRSHSAASCRKRCCTCCASNNSNDSDNDGEYNGSQIGDIDTNYNSDHENKQSCSESCRTCTELCSTKCSTMCTRIASKCQEWSSTLRETIYINVFEQRPEFKYSTRMICTIFVVVCMTYQFAVVCYFGSSSVMDFLYEEIDKYEEYLELKNITKKLNITSKQYIAKLHTTLDVLYVFWKVIIVLSWILFFVNVFAILYRYRRNMMQIFRGEKHHFTAVSVMYQKSEEIVRNCMLFAGFQIAYMIWGYFIVNLVLGVVAILFCFVLLFPFLVGNYGPANWFLAFAIIPLIVSVTLRFVQIVMTRKFFLQQRHNKKDKNKPLALDNIKAFHICNYFFVMANIETGFFSCIYRILQTLIFGVLFLGRLDRCVLMPGLELQDKGYASYIGLLFMENAHNNPVLRTFCELLLQERASKVLNEPQPENEIFPQKSALPDQLDQIPDEIIIDRNMREGKQTAQDEQRVPEVSIEDTTNRRRRTRRRWHLMYTLVNNTQLVTERRPKNVPLHQGTSTTSFVASEVLTVTEMLQQYANLKLAVQGIEAKIFQSSGALKETVAESCQTDDEWCSFNDSCLVPPCSLKQCRTIPTVPPRKRKQKRTSTETKL